VSLVLRKKAMKVNRNGNLEPKLIVLDILGVGRKVVLLLLDQLIVLEQVKDYSVDYYY